MQKFPENARAREKIAGPSGKRRQGIVHNDPDGNGIWFEPDDRPMGVTGGYVSGVTQTRVRVGGVPPGEFYTLEEFDQNFELDTDPV
jgi:hypothetical protein